MGPLGRALALLTAVFVTACTVQAPATVVAPSVATTTDTEWQKGLSQALHGHMTQSANAFVYILPRDRDPAFAETYTRHITHAVADLERGVSGNALVAFGAPQSHHAAELATTVLRQIRPGALRKSVRVLFLGDEKHGRQIKVLVERAGASYYFAET